MSQSQFDGPLASGDKQPGTPPPVGTTVGSNIGLAVLAQSVTLQAAAGITTLIGDILLPAGSQIVQIIADTVVAFTATTAGLSVGTPGAPPGYLTGIDAKVVGRAAPVFTAGQLLAMNNIGINTIVRTSIAITGPTAVGTVQVTILYVQKG